MLDMNDNINLFSISNSRREFIIMICHISSDTYHSLGLSVSPSPPKSVPSQTRNSRPIPSLLARITFKSHCKVQDNNFREVCLILF